MGFSVKTNEGSIIQPGIYFTEGVLSDGSELDSVSIFSGVFSRETAQENQFIAGNLTPNETVTVENLTPEICDISDWPVVSWVSNGSAKLKVNNGRCAVLKFLGMTDAADYALVPTGFASGSVGEFTWDILKPLMDAGTDKNIFTGSSYNSSCWAADFDFSGVPLGENGGVLITPQHLWGVWHWQRAIGSTVQFRSKSSPVTTITRTIIGKTQDFGPGFRNRPSADNPCISDMMIYTLDYPVPASIQWYPIVGDWAQTDDGLINGNAVARYYQFVGLVLDQQRRVHGNFWNASAPYPCGVYSDTDLYGTTIDEYIVGSVISQFAPATGMFLDYAGFYYSAGSGDSGCPSFVPLSGSTLAAWTVYTSPGHGMGRHELAMNLCIESADDHAGVSTGYTVTVATDPTL